MSDRGAGPSGIAKIDPSIAQPCPLGMHFETIILETKIRNLMNKLGEYPFARKYAFLRRLQRFF